MNERRGLWDVGRDIRFPFWLFPLSLLLSREMWNLSTYEDKCLQRLLERRVSFFGRKEPVWLDDIS